MPSQTVKQASVPSANAPTEDPYSIHVTRQAQRPPRSLKHNDTFLVLDAYGDIGALAGGADGLFDSDTRFLSRLDLLVNGMRPLLLGSNVSDDNSLLTVDLTNPDILADERIISEKDTIHIVRSIFLWNKAAYQRIGLCNHGSAPAAVNLTLRFDSDFADLFEVRGTIRKRRGRVESQTVSSDSVRFAYRGLDNGVRRTSVRLHPPPQELLTNMAQYHFTVPAGGACSVLVTVSCEKQDAAPEMSFRRALLSARRETRASAAGAASIETNNEVFNEMLCRAAADLGMLKTATPQGPYPYAGIPWFSTTFGRDGIITALQMLWLAPEIARGVLRRLAAYQATADDPRADAQVGKILHEMRGGEMAALHEVPFGLYYGSVDSTPLFVLLAGLYFERTGDLETISELWPAIEAALRWIDGPGDVDKDGFVEYQRLSADGLANQGWKDSFDAIFHADGQLAQGNVSLVEVQGYVFAAKRLAARCARLMKMTDRARALEREAERLAERFEATFWCPEIESYALALDGGKNACRVRASNAGQVLFTGIASRDRGRKVVASLMQPSSFSGWGIRTVAKGEARFNPMSYHNGSVWPHDNALIALGFARYGLKNAAMRVFEGLFAAASYMELRRLPELFCGFRRQRHRGPTLYPVACAPQAWASAVPFSLLAACLGLEFNPGLMSVRLREPRLPLFLDEVTIRNLRLGDAEADLRIMRRSGEDVSLDVVRSRGAIRCSIVAPN